MHLYKLLSVIFKTHYLCIPPSCHVCMSVRSQSISNNHLVKTSRDTDPTLLLGSLLLFSFNLLMKRFFSIFCLNLLKLQLVATSCCCTTYHYEEEPDCYVCIFPAKTPAGYVK